MLEDNSKIELDFIAKEHTANQENKVCYSFLMDQSLQKKFILIQPWRVLVTFILSLMSRQNQVCYILFKSVFVAPEGAVVAWWITH